MFELKLLDDPECPTIVDLDSSINDIRSHFSFEFDIIPFQLEINENEN
jgi:hypothetical protein